MQKYPIILFCFLAYLISWGSKFFMSAHDTGLIDHSFPLGVLQLFAQFGPSIAGVVMIFASGGRKSISALLRNLAQFHLHFKWYVFALFFEIILFLVIVLLSHYWGLTQIFPGSAIWYISLKNFIINTMVLALLTGLGEEVGWRGFLLPKMQSRFPVLASALILALIISFWHLRTSDISLLLEGNLAGFCESYFPDMGLRILISVPVIFVIIYLFNKTKGSLILMILFHGASNASYEWVKEITGNNDPSFTLPLFASLLWLTSVFFVPALIRQANRNELVTEVT